MNIWILKSSVLLLMFVFFGVHAAEVGKIDLSAQKLLNSRGEIVLDKRVLDGSIINNGICVGSEVLDLPVIGECPPKPGYVAIGFPVCTQKSSVPKKLTTQEISPGFIRLICELDISNATPIAAPVCDYSRCQYIEEPTFP